MGKTTQATTTQSGPPQGVLDAYYNLINQAQNTVNSHPNYQPYGGQIVPDTNGNQNEAYTMLSNLYGLQVPYLNSATNYANQGATPINLSSSVTNPLVSPYATQGANNAMASGQNLQNYGIGTGQGIANYGINAGQGVANYGTNSGQGIANYGTNAAGGLGAYAAGIGASGPQLMQYNSQNMQGFMDPYTQSVIDATSNNIDRSNALQQNDLLSAGIKAGNAFGGDRAGVAQAELARNQDLAKNQTIAQLQSQGFQNAQSQFNQNNSQALSGQQTALSGMTNAANLGLGAMGTGANLGLNAMGTGANLGLNAMGTGANLGMSGIQGGANLGLQGAQLGNNASQAAQNLALQQQQGNNSNAFTAAGMMSGLGNQTLQNYLTSANAQLGAGNAQQQQQAAQLQVPYQNYLQAQQYPYNQLNWLSGITSGLGSLAGGSGTTTSPGPNMLSQGLGAAAAGTGILGATGAFGAAGWLAPAMAMLKDGGAVPTMYQPIDFSNNTVHGYIPEAPQITRGSGAPAAPKAAPVQDPTAGAASALGKMNFGGLGGPTNILPSAAGFSPTGVGATVPMGLSPAVGPLGPLYASGGLVSPFMPGMRFADGGMPDDDPFGADKRQIALDLLRQGMGTQAPDSIPGGEPPPAPFRLDPAATEAWRKGVDSDMASGLTAPEPADTAVAQSAPRGLARAPIPPEIASGASSPPPDTAMAYTAPQGGPQGLASAPNPQGAQMLAQAMSGQPKPAEAPNGWQALLAAGLGMMSSRNPTLLGGIGEGGAQGLANYEAQQKAYNELDAHPVIDRSGDTVRVYYPSTKQWVDTGLPTTSTAERAKQAREEANSPIIIGPNGKPMENPAYLKLKQDLEKEKYIPIGTIASGDTSHPAILEQSTGKVIDAVTGKPPEDGSSFQPKGGKTVDTGTVRQIADGIKAGTLPPDTSSLYGMAGPVKAALAKDGFDLTKAQLEKKAAEKQIASLNGPQMTRFVGLASSVDQTINEVRELAKQMQNSGIPKLNAAKLALYKEAEGNSEKGQLAARYIGAVNTLKEEFANLANGGYAPTEPAWKLANEQINGNYGEKQLDASLDEIQRLIKYRVNAIPGLSTMGPGAANRYTGQQGTQPSAQPTASSHSSSPPAGAVGTRKDTQGQNWYVDKDGKAIGQVQ